MRKNFSICLMALLLSSIGCRKPEQNIDGLWTIPMEEGEKAESLAGDCLFVPPPAFVLDQGTLITEVYTRHGDDAVGLDKFRRSPATIRENQLFYKDRFGPTVHFADFDPVRGVFFAERCKTRLHYRQAPIPAWAKEIP